MKIKTKDLTGAALDCAVAKCEGRQPVSYDDWTQTWPKYSTNWGIAGPIIQREAILFHGTHGAYTAWMPDVAQGIGWGPTHLITAMRCYVSSKLGDEIDVPDELRHV